MRRHLFICRLSTAHCQRSFIFARLPLPGTIFRSHFSIRFPLFVSSSLPLVDFQLDHVTVPFHFLMPFSFIFHSSEERAKLFIVRHHRAHSTVVAKNIKLSLRRCFRVLVENAESVSHRSFFWRVIAENVTNSWHLKHVYILILATMQDTRLYMEMPAKS